MIYTLYREETYKKEFETSHEVMKPKGGTVWETKKDVKEFLDKFSSEGLMIFGVNAMWHDCEDRQLSHKARVLTKPSALIEVKQPQ